MVPCKAGIALIGSELPYRFELMLSTGRPLSVISFELRDRLGAFGYLDEISRGFFRIRGVEMGDQPAPDLIVRASQGPALLGFAGMLGLRFLSDFRQIHFDRDTRLLNLIR